MEKNNDNQAHVANPKLDDVLKIPFIEIDLNWKNKIGEGGFSLIYLGVWNGQRIAVKRLKHFVEKEEILKEAKVLSSLRHDRIVSLIGVLTEPSNDETMLVLDLAENGSLDKLLRNQGALDKSRAIQIALDIAQGIFYLHSQRIIHRDLKCANVLLYEEFTRAKLADLGVARILTSQSKASTRHGTHGFMAPEILHDEKYGTSADVYSFGAVMHEMLSNKRFPTLFKDDDHMIAKITDNVKDTEFQKLIISCCKQNPEYRPTIQACIEELQKIQLANTELIVDYPLMSASIPIIEPIGIPESELVLIQKLGEGGFGEVWLAQWHGIKVAVKRMMHSIMADRLRNELNTLLRLRYKHLVMLHGVSTDSKIGNLMLVMEYMKHGSLDDLLFKQKVKMSLTDVVQIALDVAKGLNFLHKQTPIIIHRDLQCRNILLHSNKKRAKLADFGTAIALHAHVQPNTVIGAVGIAMPPEMMDELNYNEKVDIFSFGVVLYEMLTNMRLPMFEEHNQRFVRIRANVNSKDLAELIVTCCAVYPQQRPSINTIIDILKMLKKQHIDTRK